MQTITSGSSTERIVRAIITVVVINGFAIAFFWDGYVGYPVENAQKLITSLGMDPPPDPTFDKKLTAAIGLKVVESIDPGDPYSAVTDRLDAPTFEDGQDAYFVGPSGYVAVRRNAMRVANIVWEDGAHSHVDLLVQKWFAYVLSAIGIVFIMQLIRALTTRAMLSEAGLKLPRRPVIAFDAVRGFETVGANVFNLNYTHDGKDRTVRLDPYEIRQAHAIVDAICERVGCANPLHPTTNDTGGDSSSTHSNEADPG